MILDQTKWKPPWQPRCQLPLFVRNSIISLMTWKCLMLSLSPHTSNEVFFFYFLFYSFFGTSILRKHIVRVFPMLRGWLNIKKEPTTQGIKFVTGLFFWIQGILCDYIHIFFHNLLWKLTSQNLQKKKKNRLLNPLGVIQKKKRAHFLSKQSFFFSHYALSYLLCIRVTSNSS